LSRLDQKLAEHAEAGAQRTCTASSSVARSPSTGREKTKAKWSRLERLTWAEVVKECHLGRFAGFAGFANRSGKGERRDGGDSRGTLGENVGSSRLPACAVGGICKKTAFPITIGGVDYTFDMCHSKSLTTGEVGNADCCTTIKINEDMGVIEIQSSKWCCPRPCPAAAGPYPAWVDPCPCPPPPSE
jgi:hypothetical protein